MTRRQLIVMRHAKAGPYTPTDHERELTPRGLSDAGAAGAYLASMSAVPDFALVSSAARAVATWEAVAAASGSPAVASLRDALYNASPRAVIEELRSIPEDARRAIFVGHNPTAETVVGQLDDGEGEPEAVSQLRQGYPTAALTIFDVEVPWAELTAHLCRVVDFHVGRA